MESNDVWQSLEIEQSVSLTPEEYEILFGVPPGNASPKGAPRPPQFSIAPLPDDSPSIPLHLQAPESEPESTQIFFEQLEPAKYGQSTSDTTPATPRPERGPANPVVWLLVPSVLLFVALALSPLLLNLGGEEPEVEVLAEAVVAVEPEDNETTTQDADLVELPFGVEQDEIESAQTALGNAEVTPTGDRADFDPVDYLGQGVPDSDDDCQSDHEEVMIEESLTEPVLDIDGCRATTGTWVDPFDGVRYSDTSEVVVAHLVPLAVAHQSGGAEWSPAERRAYATDLAFPASLVTIGQTSNDLRASRGPENWRPDERAWCRYAVDWISVKDRWSLSFNLSEIDVLEDMLATCPFTN